MTTAENANKVPTASGEPGRPRGIRSNDFRHSKPFRGIEGHRGEPWPTPQD